MRGERLLAREKVNLPSLAHLKCLTLACLDIKIHTTNIFLQVFLLMSVFSTLDRENTFHAVVKIEASLPLSLSPHGDERESGQKKKASYSLCLESSFWPSLTLARGRITAPKIAWPDSHGGCCVRCCHTTS